MAPPGLRGAALIDFITSAIRSGSLPYYEWRDGRVTERDREPWSAHDRQALLADWPELPPSLTRWLEFDALFLPTLTVSLSEGPSAAPPRGPRAQMSADSDAESGPSLILSRGALTVFALALSERDEQGECPVLEIPCVEEPLIRVVAPDFASWLARGFGVIPRSRSAARVHAERGFLEALAH